MAAGWRPTAATMIAKMADAIATEAVQVQHLHGRNARWAGIYISQIALLPGPPELLLSVPEIQAMRGISTGTETGWAARIEQALFLSAS